MTTEESKWGPWEDDCAQCPYCGEDFFHWAPYEELVFDPSVNATFRVRCEACGKPFEVMSACHVEFCTRKLS